MSISKATHALNKAQGEAFTGLGLYYYTSSAVFVLTGTSRWDVLLWLILARILMCGETYSGLLHRLWSWFSLWLLCVLKLELWITGLLLCRGFFLPGRNTSRSEEFRTQMWSALCARPSRSIRQVLYLQEVNLSGPRLSSWEISFWCGGCFGCCQTSFKGSQ